MSNKTPSLSPIHVHRARENNLKNVEVDFPLYSLTVVTGLSGSGKSSLVIDVLHAEAHRKFAESMTSYARQFLANIHKPNVDYISGLCPSLAIHQHQFSTGHRSTISTVTEIYDYLRILYARLGTIISPSTGKEVKCYQAIDIAEEIIDNLLDKKVIITFTIKVAKSTKKKKEQLTILTRKGFTRIYINDTQSFIEIDDEQSQQLIYSLKDWHIVVDRIVIGKSKSNKQRLIDSLQTSLFEGQQYTTIFESTTVKQYTTQLEENGQKFLAPTEALFSFNNSFGICPKCEGYGTTLDIDPDLVIPDKNKSIYEGAIAPWRGEKMSNYKKYFISQSAKYEFPIHRPLKQLTSQQLDLLWNGDKNIDGIYDFFDEVKRNTYKIQYRVLLSRYQGRTSCRICKGYRLRQEALCIKWKGKHIGELSEYTVKQLAQWLHKQKIDKYEKEVAKNLLFEIEKRLTTLLNLGLSYLTLNRPVATLSGGESQRVQLAKFIAGNLSDALYILDEPSIGLHEKDTKNLLTVLKQLRDLGNTVVVVEHDEQIIRAADHIIDMGPQAGSNGGKLITAGSIKEIQKSNSLTAQYLNKSLVIERNIKKTFKEFIKVENASIFHMKDASIQIPVGGLSVIHGPSGAGKSSLINKIIYPAVCTKLAVPLEEKKLGTIDNFVLPTSIKNVEWVSQKSVSRMSRSNPISYIQAYDRLRKIMETLDESKQLGLTHSNFSFNSPGGRCEVCKGDGKKIIEMQFLPPVELVCDVCKGKRFTDRVLSVKYNGYNIYEILQLTVDEALPIFAKQPTLHKKLIALEKVGLGYVQLGQSTATMSGGELQRLKLAYFLTKQRPEPTLFFFDEPTVGLHFHDVKKLIAIFDELLKEGHSLIVIEHNTDIIRCADWLVEVGPGAGSEGGKIMYCNYPLNPNKKK